MAKSTLKKIDVKKVTRLATAGVITLALAILVSTAWFINASLGKLAVAKNGTSAKPLKVEGVNTTLLDKVQKSMTDKSADDRRLGGSLGNPFLGTSENPSAPTPATPIPRELWRSTYS